MKKESALKSNIAAIFFSIKRMRFRVRHKIRHRLAFAPGYLSIWFFWSVLKSKFLAPGVSYSITIGRSETITKGDGTTGKSWSESETIGRSVISRSVIKGK